VKSIIADLLRMQNDYRRTYSQWKQKKYRARGRGEEHPLFGGDGEEEIEKNVGSPLKNIRPKGRLPSILSNLKKKGVG